jgi:hypothetical protein
MHIRRVRRCDTLLEPVTALAGDVRKVTLQSTTASFDAGRRWFEQGTAAEVNVVAVRWQEPPHRITLITRSIRVMQIPRGMQRQLVVAKHAGATHLTGCWHHGNVVWGSRMGVHAIQPIGCPGGIRSAAATTVMTV